MAGPQAEKNMTNMDRVYLLQDHPVFAGVLSELEQAEADRIYCRHGLSHLLDVARLSWIEVLESKDFYRKDVVYAAALLHDLGRLEELQGGRNHDEASASLANNILPECGFTPEETALISEAIMSHRSDGKDMTGLAGFLYRADKKSRNCFCCNAKISCRWSDEKKNVRFS